MKKIQLYIGTGLMLPVFIFSPVVVSAMASSTNQTAQTTPTPPNSTQTTKEKPQTPADRLESYKKAYAAKLTAAEEARLKARCKNAQTKGKSLTETITKSNTARTMNYTKITTSLDKIIVKLKDANIDTTKLQEQRTQLQKLIDTYNTDFKTYQTTLTDVTETNCIVDPTGFKASLEAARAARAVVAKDAAAIKTYIKDTVKVTLTAAKVELAKDDTKKTEEGGQ